MNRELKVYFRFIYAINDVVIHCDYFDHSI